MSEQKVYLIPDTNALIHYRFFEFGWGHHLNASEVEVCLCPQVIEEVARLKDMGEKKAVRRKAASLCQRINKLIEGGDPKLRDGEYISLHVSHPDVAKWTGLNEKAQDDRIIAFALELRTQQQNTVAVATADVSLGLRIRLSEYGVTNVPLPEEMRQELADEEDKRIQQLENELNRFKKAQPQLVTQFGGGESILRLKTRDLSAFKVLAQQEALNEEEEARRKHPLRRATISNILGAGISGEPQTAQEVQVFNALLEDFYTKVKEHRQNAAMKLFHVVELELEISNKGLVPATAVHACFQFPEGLALGDGSILTGLLGSPPKPPLTQHENMVAMMHRPYDFQLKQPASSSEDDFGSVEAKIIMPEIGPHSAIVEYTKIRQGETKKLKPLYAIFREQPHSFSIHYRIIADNAVMACDGTLPIVVGPNPVEGVR